MLDKFSIRNKVLLLLALPLLALFGLSAIVLIEKTQTLNDNQKLVSLMHLSERMSSLSHEQQKERGLSSVFIGSNGAKAKPTLVEQRKLSDAHRKDLTDYLKTLDLSLYGPLYTKEINDLMKEISKVDEIRKSIDSLSLSRKEAMDYYTGVNTLLLNAIVI